MTSKDQFAANRPIKKRGLGAPMPIAPIGLIIPIWLIMPIGLIGLIRPIRLIGLLAYCPYNSYLAHWAYCLIALIIPIWLIRPIGLIGPNKPDEPNRADRPLCGRRQKAQQKASNSNAKGRLPHCGRRPFAKSLTVKLLAMLLLAAIARARDAMRIAARPPDDGRQASPTRPAQAGCQAYHSRRRG